jgi:DnaJ-class molecular chaperone
MATPHATAFATLAEADAWDNPDCIGCHVTGVSDKHYVSDVNIPPEVWNVQCEECHGSGLLHARDGTYLASGEATCRKCHDSENSPEFDYELYKSYGVH